MNLGNEVCREKEQNESKPHPYIYLQSFCKAITIQLCRLEYTEKRMLVISFFVIKIKVDPRRDEVLRPERFDSNRGNYAFPTQTPSLPSRNFLNTLTIPVQQR